MSGFLLFGKSPREVLPQAVLLATIHYSNGRDETRDFDGPLVRIPEEVEKWLKDKLPNTIDRSQMHRREQPELPFELVREAVVNALVHRDYSIEGAKCQLFVTSDTIVVKSPGEPIEPITFDQIQSFDAPMLSRNPLLHFVFAKMKLAEERGFGLRSLRTRASELGLPLPAYTSEPPYLVLTLFRSVSGATRSLDAEILERLNADERTAWELIVTRGSITSPDLMDQLRFDERKAQRILKKLQDVKLLKKVGKGPATRYEVIHA